VAHDSHSVHVPSTRSRKAEIDRIVETMLYLYAESRRVTKTQARERGLTSPQVSVLKILEATDDLSLTELSERMSAKNSTITGIVDRMERDGLVMRDRSSSDRRVVLIRATEKGRELARSVKVGAMELLTSALGALNEVDRQELRRIVLELAEHVRGEIDKRESRRDDDEGE
jgi:DNA-binding MarR family transcriptional regulator